MTIVEMDSKGEEALNQESLLEAFKEVAKWAQDVEGITFTIQAKKEDNN